MQYCSANEIPDYEGRKLPEDMINEYAEWLEKQNMHNPSEIAGEINPRQGEIDEVMEETAKEASTQEIEQNTQNREDKGSNPGGDKRE